MSSTLPTVSDCCTLCEGLSVTIVEGPSVGGNPVNSGSGDPSNPGGTTSEIYINTTCGSIWVWNPTTLTWTQINLNGATGMYVVPTIVELRQIATTTCPPVWARTLGNLVVFDAQGSEYGWDASSLDADTGLSVIKPDDVAVADPGRWIQIA